MVTRWWEDCWNSSGRKRQVLYSTCIWICRWHPQYKTW